MVDNDASGRRVTLKFDLLTTKVDRFISLPCGRGPHLLICSNLQTCIDTSFKVNFALSAISPETKIIVVKSYGTWTGCLCVSREPLGEYTVHVYH